MRSRAVAIAIAVLSASSSAGWADSDTLKPVTFGSFQGDMKKALARDGLKEPLNSEGCLPGDATKRTVCTVNLGSIMRILAESQVGGKDIVGITMICTGQTSVDQLKCLVAYGAAMSMTAPDLPEENRRKIIGIITQGLDVGNETTVRTDERKYSLQKSIGPWFHIYAADAGDD